MESSHGRFGVKRSSPSSNSCETGTVMYTPRNCYENQDNGYKSTSKLQNTAYTSTITYKYEDYLEV